LSLLELPHFRVQLGTTIASFSEKDLGVFKLVDDKVTEVCYRINYRITVVITGTAVVRPA
jgi:hypothetical protein